MIIVFGIFSGKISKRAELTLLSSWNRGSVLGSVAWSVDEAIMAAINPHHTSALRMRRIKHNTLTEMGRTA